MHPITSLDFHSLFVLNSEIPADVTGSLKYFEEREQKTSNLLWYLPRSYFIWCHAETTITQVDQGSEKEEKRLTWNTTAGYLSEKDLFLKMSFLCIQIFNRYFYFYFFQKRKKPTLRWAETIYIYFFILYVPYFKRK